MKIKNLSASRAHRWWQCHGSARAELVSPIIEAREVSLEGTAAHSIFEKCLRTGVDAESFLGETIWLPRDKVRWGPVPEEMVDHVQAGVDLVRSRRGKGKLWLEENIAIKAPVLVRGQLDVGWYGRYKNLDGKLEWQLHVLDLKYGRLLVEAHDNKQLYIYGLGKALALRAENKPIDTVHLWIYQPRSSHADGPYRHIELPLFDLLDFNLELQHIVEEVLKPRAPMQAGPWCLYCGAHAVCPVAEQANLKLARTKLGEHDTGRVGELLHKLPQLQQFINAVKELAKNMDQQGTPPIGWVRAAGSNRRYFNGEPKEQVKTLLPKLRKQFGLKDDDLAPRKLVSVRQVETLVAKGRSKEDAKRRKLLLEKYWHNRPTANRLVPADSGAQALDAALFYGDDDGRVD